MTKRPEGYTPIAMPGPSWTGNFGRSEERHDKTQIPDWKPGRVTVEKEVKDGVITWKTEEYIELGKETDAVPRDDEDRLLTAEGLDPAEWDVTSHRVAHWQVGLAGVDLESRRLTVKKRETKKILNLVDQAELLIKPYLKRADKTVFAKQTGDILVVPVGDLQIGKPDGGGTPALIERFCKLTSSVAAQIKDNGKLEGLVLPWLGDCVEGIVSQNGKLVTRMDLTPDAQVYVYVRLLLHQVMTLAPLAKKVLVPVVPGNHDETYREVKMPATSSWAITGAQIVETVLRQFAPEEFKHVSFIYPPRNEHNITVNVGPKSEPLYLGFTHGHIMGSSPNQALSWWKGQSHGRQDIGKADILFSAHWHHLRTEFTGGDRTWIQIPALDGGSDWFRQRTGDDVPAGMVTVWLTPGQGCFWRDLTVHAA